MGMYGYLAALSPDTVRFLGREPDFDTFMGLLNGENGLEIGQMWDAVDRVVSTLLDGQAFSTDQVKGKVLLINFWATWCAPCRVQHPLYEDVKRIFSDRSDLVFLAMDTDDDRAIVEPFLAEQQWDKTVYFDDGLARLLQVSSIPTTILIDKQGRVASRMNGFAEETFVAQISDRIRTLLTQP